MLKKKRSEYTYTFKTSYYGAKKKRGFPWKLFLWLTLFLAVPATVAYYLLDIKPAQVKQLVEYLPVPKHLQSMTITWNGEPRVLEDGYKLTVNPRDELQIMEVKTDGWVQWGLELSSDQVNAELMQQAPVTIHTLLPEESFEEPKDVEIRALWLDRELGDVVFEVRLDSRDWLMLSQQASEADSKIRYLEEALKEKPNNTLIKTQLAKLCADRGELDRAAGLYEEILALGKSRQILERLLEIYDAQGRIDDALAVQLDLLRLSGESEDYKALSDYLVKHLSTREAANYLEEHKTDFPESFRMSLELRLAGMYTDLEDWKAASRAYEQAIERGADDPTVFHNLSVTTLRSGDVGDAVRALEEYLKVEPGDLQAWIRLGALYEQKDDLTRARAAYERVLQSDPRNENVLLRMVNLLQKIGDNEALRETYATIAEIKPDNKLIHFNLGVLRYKAEDWEKAAEAFETVATLDKTDVDSRRYLLEIYRKLEDREAQVRVLRSLIELQPENEVYYQRLYVLYDEAQDYKSMVAFFKEVVERFPDSVAYHEFLLYGLLKLDREKQALEQLEALIRLQPEEPKHVKRAASLYLSLDKTDEALKMIERYLELNPEDEEYLRQAAVMYERQDNYTEALKRLEALLKLDPDDKELLEKAAELYEKQQKYTQALKKVEQLLKHYPDDKRAKNEYMRLRLRVMSLGKGDASGG